ncbi:MAG TPA: EAL domain-containing protein [Candidatus Dormibacteraeota bacterium]
MPGARAMASSKPKGGRTRARDAATLRALYDLSVAVSGVRDVVEVARLAVDSARPLIKADGVVVYAYDTPSGYLNPLYEDGSTQPETPVRPGEGAIGLAFQTGHPIRVEDYNRWEHALRESKGKGMVAVLAVPLIAEDQPIGAIGVWNYQPREFTVDDEQMLQLFASHVAPALLGARRTEEAEAKARMFQTLHELTVASAGVLDPEALANLVVTRAASLLHVEGAGVWAWEPALGLLQQLATANPVRHRPTNRKAGESAIGVAFAERRVVSVGDLQQWPAADPRGRAIGIRSVLAIPLVIGDHAVGSLAVWSHEARRFDPEDEQLMTLLAAQVAPALEASRLAADREEQAEIFKALNDLARAASGLLEPEALARLTVDRARDLLHVRSAALLWSSPDGTTQLRLADNDPTHERPEAVPAATGLVGQVIAHRRPVRIANVQAWDDIPSSWRGGPIKSAAAVPLLVGDRALGGLVARSESLAHFTDERLELMSLLAAQVAPALAAARLHADLVSSEHRFRSLFETIACGVLVQGPGGIVLDANRAAEDMLGLSLEEMRGRRSTELWSVENSRRPALLALESRRPIRNHELAIRRRDGFVRWFQADSIPVLDAMGRAVQVVTSLIDVTERHRAQDALRESEERFRAVFDRAGIGIARLRLDAVIEDANPALCAMLGYDRAEVIGHTPGDFMHNEDWDRNELEAVADGKVPSLQAEIRYLKRDGTEMWGNTTLTAVPGPDGKPAFLIGMVEDFTERKKQEAALSHQALHDALTDLPNRTLLNDRLRQAIRVAHRERHKLALLVMDLDRFKEVNDTFGHQAGDILLRDVAARLRSGLRGSDTVARLGGDEFAILLGHVETIEGAITTARKLLESLEAPFQIEAEDVQIGASLGIAVFPDHGGDADLLMRHADVAMYVAKRGATGFAIYTPETDQHTPGRLALINDLRGAVDRHELELVYQPKVDMRSRKMTGVEALVRWRHPRHGVLMPDQFISLAEHTGLIRGIGLWVLEAASKQCAAWRAKGLDLTVAVNLSMRNLHDGDLGGVLQGILRRHRIRPGWLVVEITETTLMADPEHALKVIGRLEELGVELSIDDFGTGYSSLAYLKRLPVHELKIDRSFVAEMADDASAAVIVRSTVDLGHNLGLRVVAEGVEDEGTLELVAEDGCDLAQGNLLSPPLPAAELVERMPDLGLLSVPSS